MSNYSFNALSCFSCCTPQHVTELAFWNEIKVTEQSSSLKWKYVLYQTVRGLFTLTRAVPPVSNKVPVINYYLSFRFPLHVQTVLITRAPWAEPACSSFVRRIASSHVTRLYLFSHFLQLMRLVYFEWMSVTRHYQLPALISVIMCMLMLPHTVYRSDLNWSGAWPRFVSTKLLTVSSWSN